MRTLAWVFSIIFLVLGIFATWLALQESSWIGWASVISLLVGAFFLNPAIWNERADTGIGAMKKQRAFIAITGGFAGTLMLVSWGFYAALVPTSSYRPHDQLAPPPDPALVEFDGKTHVYFSVGDQLTWMNVKGGIFPGTADEFFARWYKEPGIVDHGSIRAVK